MADENVKQTTVLENILGELRKSNAAANQASMMNGGDRLVSGVPFGSAQFSDNMEEGLENLADENTEALDRVGAQLVENAEATQSNASADEEDQRDKNNIFKKMTASLQGIGASLKDKAVNITKGLFGKIPMGTLLGLGIMALISFMNSEQWKMVGEWIDTAIEALNTMWTDYLKPTLVNLKEFALAIRDVWVDPNWENIKTLFGEHSGKLAVIAGLLAVKTFGLATMVTGVKEVGSLINSKFGALSAADQVGLKKIVGIGGLTVAVGMGIKDAIEAVAKAKDWKVDKISAGIGGFLGGSAEGWTGAFQNAGKWAIAGVSAGFMLGGPVGALIGGIGGAAIGAILGYFGGEKIAKGINAMGTWISEAWDDLYGAIGGWIKSAIRNIKDILGLTTKKEKEAILKEEIERAEKDAKIAEQNAIDAEKASRLLQIQMDEKRRQQGQIGEGPKLPPVAALNPLGTQQKFQSKLAVWEANNAKQKQIEIVEKKKELDALKETPENVDGSGIKTPAEKLAMDESAGMAMNGQAAPVVVQSNTVDASKSTVKVESEDINNWWAGYHRLGAQMAAGAKD